MQVVYLYLQDCDLHIPMFAFIWIDTCCSSGIAVPLGVSTPYEINTCFLRVYIAAGHSPNAVYYRLYPE